MKYQEFTKELEGTILDIWDAPAHSQEFKDLYNKATGLVKNQPTLHPYWHKIVMNGLLLCILKKRRLYEYVEELEELQGEYDAFQYSEASFAEIIGKIKESGHLDPHDPMAGFGSMEVEEPNNTTIKCALRMQSAGKEFFELIHGYGIDYQVCVDPFSNYHISIELYYPVNITSISEPR